MIGKLKAIYAIIRGWSVIYKVEADINTLTAKGSFFVIDSDITINEFYLDDRKNGGEHG